MLSFAVLTPPVYVQQQTHTHTHTQLSAHLSFVIIIVAVCPQICLFIKQQASSKQQQQTIAMGNLNLTL